MALTITAVKRFRTVQGVRRGLVDITFDADGPTWSVTKAMLKLPGGILRLNLTGHLNGFVLGVIQVAGNQTCTIDARQEEAVAAGGGLLAAGASDLNTATVRGEYTGY